MKLNVIEPGQEQEDQVPLRAFQKSGSETAFREMVLVVAPVIVAAAIPIAFQWHQNHRLQDEAWLSENQQHPSYDGMAAQYAHAIAAEHPQVALAWAQSIGDENARAATELANARVYIERDGDAGKQALLAAGYSQHTIDRAGTPEDATVIPTFTSPAGARAGERRMVEVLKAESSR